MFTTFLCVNERSRGHCIARYVITGRRGRSRSGRRRHAVTMMTETDTDDQTDHSTEERPEDGVEDWPAVYSSLQHRSGLDVPRIIETRHRLAMFVRRGVQLTTEIVNSFAIPQRVARTFVQCALRAQTDRQTHIHISFSARDAFVRLSVCLSVWNERAIVSIRCTLAQI